ncbi:hypothetical protein [Burkholderia sp. SCN-KJ]|uniref:hypothetical protein n=1 Tax=Burkholderia sp. SCN-KJ TaxID=2969248 RepID=UPI00214FF982|nr:hypothetical protein [Burkholderia sp. SCN-KJ]MCR4471589.1 hypothetical protein [Burkholderia sp. SCN-KJ]
MSEQVIKMGGRAQMQLAHAKAALESVRAQLAWTCEVLIPDDPVGELPSALEADVPGSLLPRALVARDDLQEQFVAVLASLPENPPENPLERLKGLGSAFDLISQLIAGAYFLDIEINRKLRYPGQDALDYNPDYDEITATVERFMATGPRYIPTPV